jgi:hypothetical protein
MALTALRQVPCPKCGYVVYERTRTVDGKESKTVDPCTRCNPGNRTFEFGPGLSELQFSASLGAEAKNLVFLEELERLGYDVGTDADYSSPKSFYTIIVRCRTKDVPEVRNAAIKYGIHSKNPGSIRSLGWEISP